MPTSLARATGLPVGYWHDAGHGAKLEYLGFFEHEDYLRRWGDRIVGMHIHDTRTVGTTRRLGRAPPTSGCLRATCAQTRCERWSCTAS